VDGTEEGGRGRSAEWGRIMWVVGVRSKVRWGSGGVWGGRRKRAKGRVGLEGREESRPWWELALHDMGENGKTNFAGGGRW